VVGECVEGLRLRDAEEVALTLRRGANQTQPSSCCQNNRCSCPNNRRAAYKIRFLPRQALSLGRQGCKFQPRRKKIGSIGTSTLQLFVFNSYSLFLFFNVFSVFNLPLVSASYSKRFSTTHFSVMATSKTDGRTGPAWQEAQANDTG
jgi:hypothetical protein